jgi:hypothetical protein
VALVKPHWPVGPNEMPDRLGIAICRSAHVVRSGNGNGNGTDDAAKLESAVSKRGFGQPSRCPRQDRLGQLGSEMGRIAVGLPVVSPA